MVVSACHPNSEAAKVLSASRAGVVIPPGDDAALARVILAIRCGDIDVEAYRRRARDYAVRHHDREAVYGQLVEELNRLKS